MVGTSEKWVDDLLGKMTLAQKIGQMLVFGFAGPVITPDIVDMIQKYHVGGLRICLKFRTQTLLHDLKPGTKPNKNILRSLVHPHGNHIDYADPSHCTSCTPKEYAEVLNRLRDYAFDRDLGIPIHFTIDQEGNGSDDLINGQRLFPNPMGITAAGEPELAYKVAKAIGMQARALGINMIHSPVVDVNTNPKNPEIGTRAYSDNQDQVIEYALQSLKGFKDTGMIATAKHFPGRGESEADAHWGLPSVNVDKETMYRVHLAPYRALIEAGIPAIMTAQCCYPALGVDDIPASTSEKLIKELLREELKFNGVITTDNMMMGGILERFEIREAIVRAIEAGNDLVLYRDESAQRPRIINAVLAAVKDGRISEQQIDISVERILKMRGEMGLVENGGKVNAENAAQPIDDPFVVKTAQEAAEKSVLLLRDDAKILPLKPHQKILLVEQVFPTHQMANNMACHPGMLWEEMNVESSNVGSVEIPNLPTKHDWERVLRRVGEADIIVSTNYYYHKSAASNSELIQEIQKTGKPVIVISNNPYEFATPRDLPTVITVFTAGGRENLRAAVKVLYGKLKPNAKIPVKIA
jgi:beta-N-acetylhexosaminidase